MSRILHLTLTRKWFDMVKSGEKTEEYREIKPYWIKRLINSEFSWDCETSDKRNYHFVACPNGFYKKFDEVHFRNGYGSGAPTIKITFPIISRGEGKPEWGAELGKEYFVIKLGKII